jgi:hypothetical protein
MTWPSPNKIYVLRSEDGDLRIRTANPRSRVLGRQRPEDGSRPYALKIADKVQGVALPLARRMLVLCFAAKRFGHTW